MTLRSAAVLLVLLVAGCAKPPEPERPHPPGYLPAYPPREQTMSWDCWRH